jgi:hypothetical protein
MAEDKPIASTKLESPAKLDISKWREPVEIVARIAVAMVGVAYVVGLIIQNMHIRKYGISYLGFLQIEYVMAGTLWAFLVGFTYGLVVILGNYARLSYNELKGKHFRRRLWIVVRVGFVSLSTYFLFVGVISFLSDGGAIWKDWRVVFALLFNVMAIWNLVTKLRAISSLSTLRLRAFDILYAVAFLLITVAFYSHLAFPKFSPTFGGGKKQTAEFIIKAEQLDTMKTIGFQVS